MAGPLLQPEDLRGGVDPDQTQKHPQVPVYLPLFSFIFRMAVHETGYRVKAGQTPHPSSLQGQAAFGLNFSVPLISCVTLSKLFNLSVAQFLTSEMEVIIIVPAVLSRFSCVQLFAAPWTVVHQASLSMGFPGKNTGVDCHFLLQVIFLTQELNLHLLCLLYLAGGFFTTSASWKALILIIGPTS